MSPLTSGMKTDAKLYQLHLELITSVSFSNILSYICQKSFHPFTGKPGSSLDLG